MKSLGAYCGRGKRAVKIAPYTGDEGWRSPRCIWCLQARWFAHVREDSADGPWFGDERDEPDVAAARWALERKLPPTRAINFAHAIREVSCERGFSCFPAPSPRPSPGGRG